MSLRAIWKGSISFGLVTIPIGLHRATCREELKFRLLRKSDLSPVNYRRVAEVDGKEVAWEDIVKGYEYEPGRFVVLKDEDFKRVDIEATQTVDILDFVELDQIDPMYFDEPYYLSSGKSGQKGYVLLRDVLRKTGKVAVAKVVIKTRQYLAVVKPYRNLLVLELMHFADELLNPAKVDAPKELPVTKKEMQMAAALVDNLTDKWDPKKYTDDYRDALLKLIEQKARTGGKELPGEAPKRKTATNVVDLAAVLQQSLKQTRSGARKTRKKAGRTLRKAA